MKKTSLAVCLLGLALVACDQSPANTGATLGDTEVENIVRQSYQYVAMYNTINIFAMQKGNPFGSGGWNKMFIAEGLADHTLTAIPRPNNDTLYSMSMLDMRGDAIVIQFPAFDSKFVSLETSAYDHYVDIPLSTTEGDFNEPTTMRFYTSRTMAATVAARNIPKRGSPRKSPPTSSTNRSKRTYRSNRGEPRTTVGRRRRAAPADLHAHQARQGARDSRQHRSRGEQPLPGLSPTQPAPSDRQRSRNQIRRPQELAAC